MEIPFTIFTLNYDLILSPKSTDTNSALFSDKIYWQ